ncbi:glutamine dependent NAD+ synthetase (plasmid) [Legionella adelaidensis]|uniref:Glutamine-dependent NAD(+) synthetase n=1 Tax=Legionella adelaidensis TaxID=45056 RepID=A0A0W0R4J1_9GAMM|nr:NAD+ synthase [Legionella adelaidensis]KTC65934.1 glutamine dependent NAD+ synthetase [Legionella adelaidensis]VEH85554.1 glutamine dependent NAD+ synthetase [Legionella adelaidensis]
MQNILNILMVQMNPLVGAIKANTRKIIEIIQKHQGQYDLLVFPELILTGYPPEDLLLRLELFTQVEESLKEIYEAVKSGYVIVGHPSLEQGRRFNSASIIGNNNVIRYHKQMLPNYGVFDEARYFSPGNHPIVFTIKNYRIGLCICEDIWQPEPAANAIKAGAEVLVCINASPFEKDKYEQRVALLQQHAKKGVSILYVNQTGGQDEIVFDGQSLAMNSDGEICARAPLFEESLFPVSIEGKHVKGTLAPLLQKEALIYTALQYGLKEYIVKNNFPGVLLGLSGGIDSAFTLALASDALGPSKVHAVLMPSRYTSSMSNEDAITQADTLQVPYSILSIEPAFNAFLETLAPEFKNLKPDITEENLQARIRGSLLMALSNKSGKMVISTSNKSEAAVGYSTLYGDMVGGMAPIKDVLKTEIYALAHYRNKLSPVIPERVIKRAPSAELAPNQKDQDALPDYAILDGILRLYIEKNLSTQAIIKKGFSEKDVSRVIRLIIRNEYKRRQSPPGIKISNCNFDRDWRYPITSGFEHFLRKI